MRRQKNQLIETVEGVNTPVLERLIQDNAPSKVAPLRSPKHPVRCCSRAPRGVQDELAAGVDDPDSADEEDTTQGGGGGTSLACYRRSC